MTRFLQLILLLALLVPVQALANSSATAAINGLRTARGLPTLRYSPQLEAVAARHAQDMARRGFFSHRGSNGSNVAGRAKAAGYHYCFVAENIAKGQRSLQEALQSWYNSRPHRRNMLRPRLREFALAEAPGHIWVMVLADPGC
jgi:uncharacterized protein YkwD